MGDGSVTRSSGNVFADIGVKHPEEALLKAQLIAVIRSIVDTRKLSQVAAADLVGVRQPDLSKLLRGQSTGFSLERLFDIVTALGNDVEIKITAAAGPKGGRVLLREAA